MGVGKVARVEDGKHADDVLAIGTHPGGIIAGPDATSGSDGPAGGPPAAPRLNLGWLFVPDAMVVTSSTRSSAGLGYFTIDEPPWCSRRRSVHAPQPSGDLVAHPCRLVMSQVRRSLTK